MSEFWKKAVSLFEELIDNETLIIVFLFILALKIISLLVPNARGEYPVPLVSLVSTLAGMIVGGYVGYLRGKRKTSSTDLPVVKDTPPDQSV